MELNGARQADEEMAVCCLQKYNDDKVCLEQLSALASTAKSQRPDFSSGGGEKRLWSAAGVWNEAGDGDEANDPTATSRQTMTDDIREEEKKTEI